MKTFLHISKALAVACIQNKDCIWHEAVSLGEKYCLRNWCRSLEGSVFQNRVWWLISWKSNEFCFLVKTSAWIRELDSCVVWFLFNPWQDGGLYLTDTVNTVFSGAFWGPVRERSVLESRGCVTESLSGDKVQKLGCLRWHCGLKVWVFTSPLLQLRFFIILTVAVIPLRLCQFLSHSTEDHSRLFAVFCRAGSYQHWCTAGKFPTVSGFSRCDENNIKVQQLECMLETAPR